jgi:hypothetical protein
MNHRRDLPLAVSEARFQAELVQRTSNVIGTPLAISLVQKRRLDMIASGTDANGAPIIPPEDLLDTVEEVVAANGQRTFTVRTPERGFFRFLWTKWSVKGPQGRAGAWSTVPADELAATPAFYRLKQRQHLSNYLHDIRLSMTFVSSQGRVITTDQPLSDLCEAQSLGLVRIGQGHIFTGDSEIKITLRNTSNAERRVSANIFGYLLVL